MMKTSVAWMTIVVLFTCAPVAAQEQDRRLRVVGSVHANEQVLVSGQEKRERRRGHCVDDSTLEVDPVCASNGKQYRNMKRFEYSRCLIKVKSGEDITVMDQEFCTNAMREDLERNDA